MTNTGQAVRVGGVATIVAGLGIGLLQLVQGLASSFDDEGRYQLVSVKTLTDTVASAHTRRLVNATLESWLKSSKDRFCVPAG